MGDKAKHLRASSLAERTYRYEYDYHYHARPAEASGTFLIGGEIRVRRLGFGAMQLTGPGVWGSPADHSEAIAVLQRAVELGINLIDTASDYDRLRLSED